VRWAGAAFLLAYGGLAAIRAVRGGPLAEPGLREGGTRLAALGTCLSLTWLNPHVYLDTVLLLGSLAGAHGPEGRWWFAAGAGLGSIAWFSALGAGARYLAPLFQRRNAWRVLDGCIAVIMITLAVLLVA
jgi:L-lysine exporter family protein LysE/ArgO